jgi:2-(1,2-epoxy-1,2-dihydrophenyl)acetyl-CoA isomerase
MVQGYAVGAGFDIALACDFRIASQGSRLASIYVKRGMGGGCSYLLPRYVGLGKANELLLLGDFIGIDEALRLSLVTKVCPDAELEAKTYEFAARLAKGPTAAIGAIKNARNQGLACDPVKGIEHQILCNVELMFHKDAREGPRRVPRKARARVHGGVDRSSVRPVRALRRGQKLSVRPDFGRLNRSDDLFVEQGHSGLACRGRQELGITRPCGSRQRPLLERSRIRDAGGPSC